MAVELSTREKAPPLHHTTTTIQVMRRLYSDEMRLEFDSYGCGFLAAQAVLSAVGRSGIDYTDKLKYLHLAGKQADQLGIFREERPTMRRRFINGYLRGLEWGDHAQ